MASKESKLAISISDNFSKIKNYQRLIKLALDMQDAEDMDLLVSTYEQLIEPYLDELERDIDTLRFLLGGK